MKLKFLIALFLTVAIASIAGAQVVPHSGPWPAGVGSPPPPGMEMRVYTLHEELDGLTKAGTEAAFEDMFDVFVLEIKLKATLGNYPWGGSSLENLQSYSTGILGHHCDGDFYAWYFVPIR